MCIISYHVIFKFYVSILFELEKRESACSSSANKYDQSHIICSDRRYCIGIYTLQSLVVESCFFYRLTKFQHSQIVQNKLHEKYILKADSWKAVPDSEYTNKIKQPAIIYGVYHLLRLLGKYLINNMF